MAEQEWTVKELTEALKRFPVNAKVYYDMGPKGPETIGKAQYERSMSRPADTRPTATAALTGIEPAGRSSQAKRSKRGGGGGRKRSALRLRAG